MIVVDASLAAKWFIPETDSDAALDFLSRSHGLLASPDLLLSEVAGAIVRRANMRLVTSEQAAAALESWRAEWDDGVVAAYRLTAGMIAQAGHIALKIGHPLSDCIYLALALDLGCELVTSDAKFRDKVLPVSNRVKLLADYN